MNPILLTILFLFITTKAMAFTIAVGENEGPLRDFCQNHVIEIYKIAKIKVKTTLYPYQRSIIETHKGVTQAECASIRGFDKVFKNLVRVNPSIISFESIAVKMPKTKEELLNGWKDLREYRVGIINGIKYTKKRTRKFKNIVVKKDVSELFELFELLKKGRIDFIIAEKFDGYAYSSFIKKYGFKVVERPLEKVELFHYLNIDNLHLLPGIQKAILIYKKNNN